MFVFLNSKFRGYLINSRVHTQTLHQMSEAWTLTGKLCNFIWLVWSVLLVSRRTRCPNCHLAVLAVKECSINQTSLVRPTTLVNIKGGLHPEMFKFHVRDIKTEDVQDSNNVMWHKYMVPGTLQATTQSAKTSFRGKGRPTLHKMKVWLNYYQNVMVKNAPNIKAKDACWFAKSRRYS